MIRSIQKALSPLHYILFPQQRWLTKKYSRTWMDKDKIIFETLFACVVHWVEVEGKDDRSGSYDEDLKAGHVSLKYVKDKQKIEDKITNIYLWHTHDRAILESEIDSLVKDYLNSGFSAKKIIDLRSKIEKKDKQYMKQIVDICDHMWT